MVSSPDYLKAVKDLDYAEALLEVPDLWASVIFGYESIPDFHSHLWQFLADESIRELVIELPAGHSKTNLISIEYPIYRLCRDNNDRICILQKGIEQAKDVVGGIKRELTGNEVLNSLYGPFKPEESSGYPWTMTTLRVRGNTDTHQKTNSVHAYGWSSTDVMGNRFKCFLGDDFVTEDNSDTPEKRLRIKNKEETEWNPTLVGAGNPRFIYMGTPMFYDDAFEGKLSRASDYLGPEDWRKPSEVDKSGLVFIRRNAEKGRKPGQTLWPLKADSDFLEEKKHRGYVNYLRRYCCVVGDPETQIFKQVAIEGGIEENTSMYYPGCLDKNRSLGEADPSWRVICGADPSSGKKTGASGQFAHVVLGVEPKGETYHLIDLFTGPVPMSRREDYGDPKDAKSQVGTIIHRHHKYHAAMTVIEDNAQQHAWITTVRDADPTVRLKKHTTGRQKVDKEVGVESMAGIIESGRLRLPYGDKHARKATDKLIEQLVRYPHFSYSDLVMALWFAVTHARKRAKVEFFDMAALRAQARPLQKAV